jgi:hypothetical protein
MSISGTTRHREIPPISFQPVFQLSHAAYAQTLWTHWLPGNRLEAYSTLLSGASGDIPGSA